MMKISFRRSAFVLTVAFFGFVGCASSASAQGFGGGGATGGGGAGAGAGGGTAGGGAGTGGRTMTSPGASSQNSTSTASGADSGASALGTPVERRFSDVGTATAGGASGLGGAGGLGGLGGFGGGGFGGLSPFGLNPFGTGAGAAEEKPTIRTRLRSEVVVPRRSISATSANIQQRISRSYRQPRFLGVAAQVTENGTVLRGTVATESDRRMAELMMRLEPGVNNIDNQIIVSQ